MNPYKITTSFGSRKIIGITGFIGAGKSVVSRILRCNGFFVYDCDYHASALMKYNYRLRKELHEILGEMCYDGNGDLNKKYVAAQIFNDKDTRDRINKAVHQAVKEDFLKIANTLFGKVFIESAIMSTSGLDRVCDEIWIVDAPEDLRIQRVMLRNKLTESEVKKRMLVQKNELSHLSKDKIVIIANKDNSNTLENVIKLASPKMKSSQFEFLLSR